MSLRERPIAPQFVCLSMCVSGRAWSDSPYLSLVDCIAWAIEREGDPVDLPPVVEKSLAIRARASELAP